MITVHSWVMHDCFQILSFRTVITSELINTLHWCRLNPNSAFHVRIYVAVEFTRFLSRNASSPFPFNSLSFMLSCFRVKKINTWSRSSVRKHDIHARGMYEFADDENIYIYIYLYDQQFIFNDMYISIQFWLIGKKSQSYQLSSSVLFFKTWQQ